MKRNELVCLSICGIIGISVLLIASMYNYLRGLCFRHDFPLLSTCAFALVLVAVMFYCLLIPFRSNAGVVFRMVGGSLIIWHLTLLAALLPLSAFSLHCGLMGGAKTLNGEVFVKAADDVRKMHSSESLDVIRYESAEQLEKLPDILKKINPAISKVQGDRIVFVLNGEGVLYTHFGFGAVLSRNTPPIEMEGVKSVSSAHPIYYFSLSDYRMFFER